MKPKLRTAEQMVRKCFYESDTSDWEHLARAARRFVKMENERKGDRR